MDYKTLKAQHEVDDRPWVLFVGSNPSKKNLHRRKAFEGTQSGIRLMSWIKFLGIGRAHAVNVSHRIGKITFQENEIHFVCREIAKFSWRAHGGFSVVALGKAASKALASREIPHFTLPHPSGLNRKLNDHSYVESELRKCQKFITSDDPYLCLRQLKCD